MPGVPTNLNALVQGNSVTLTWGAPATGGTPASYLLQAGTTPGGSEIGAIPASGTGLAFNGVPDGRYYVRVRGVNAAGTGAPTSDLVLNVGCTGPPATPSTLTASVAGSVVALAWNVPTGHDDHRARGGIRTRGRRTSPSRSRRPRPGSR